MNPLEARNRLALSEGPKENRERKEKINMNKKILLGILMIGLVSALAGAGVYAYFTDTETIAENVFQAGTVDIEISAGEEETLPFYIDDMKPCEVGYGTMRIDNVGTNPVNVYKLITNITCEGGIHPESEYDEDPDDTKNWIDEWITYDLSVEVYNAAGTRVWWQVVFPEDTDLTIYEISNFGWSPLGMIPFEGYMIVTQSYHMKADTGNWAQGDKMTFDIVINAEQLNGPMMSQLFLVPKTEGDDEWIIDWDKLTGTGDDFNTSTWDGPHAFLDYTTTGPTFDYTLYYSGLTAGTNYSLIYYADPWPGDNPGALIATFTATGGKALISGSPDLGMDLPSSPDANFPGGAKIWLVASSDYDAGTNSMTAWNPDNYLFEVSLIKYDDADA